MLILRNRKQTLIKLIIILKELIKISMTVKNFIRKSDKKWMKKIKSIKD